MKQFVRLGCVSLFVALAGCASKVPPTADEYAAVDQLYESVAKVANAESDLTLAMDIDHSRQAMEAGAVMGPSRVALVRNDALALAVIQDAPLALLDLPVRVLAYEDTEGNARVTYNTASYVNARVDGQLSATTQSLYSRTTARLLRDVPTDAIHEFSNNAPDESGMITLTSDFNYADTVKRIYEAINAQDDTIVFGEIDYGRLAAAHKKSDKKILMILFGGPAPGAKAMVKAPTLGLDGFCQKFLVWEDDQGVVHLTFNDLRALAKKQEVPINIALRVIQRRLTSTFEDALQE